MSEKFLNLPSIEKLNGVVELFLEHSSRINQAKPQNYWYPLSMATYDSEEIIQVLDSLCSFRTTMWEKTNEFENRFTDYQGSKASVMVNSGSSADLLMSYLLVDPLKPIIEKGSEVIAPVVTWPTHLWSVKMAGLKLKLVDVDPQTLNIDLDDLKRSITPNSKAIFLVHLMGNPCPMDEILEIARNNNLIILEDCCEALGSEYNGMKVGSFGLCGSFSFFFSHHMTTMEGGMVVCNDQEIADRLKILRAHGWLRNVDSSKITGESHEIDPRYTFVGWGFNVRPTDLQAGFGLSQLEKLPEFNNQRKLLAERFFNALETIPHLCFPSVEPNADPCWFSFPIMVSSEAPFSRNEIIEHLEMLGIETRPIVAGNIARHPVAKLFPEFNIRRFPGADEVHKRGFYLGLSPFFNNDMIDKLTNIIQEFVIKYKGRHQ